MILRNRDRIETTHGLYVTEEKLRMNERAKVIAGVDEAGRGPMAGPVVAAAVVLRPGIEIEGINDSKKLSAKQREALFHRILETCEACGIGIRSSYYIDKTNIAVASFSAMRAALKMLSRKIEPDLILVDGFKIPDISTRQFAIVHGDSTVASIACASILAKVIRDRIMAGYEEIYPEYRFGKHKGYCTQEHNAILKKEGPTPIHRRSFRPVWLELQRTLDLKRR
jgi:ribonuclease HII